MKNISFLFFFLVILIGLIFVMPGSFGKSLEFLQDAWQWSTKFLNEIWESMKYFWESNVQPFIDKLKTKTKSIIEEKMKKDKPKIEQEFNREVQEMKAETSKTGAYLLEKINGFIRR